jgi:hypothetical protein
MRISLRISLFLLSFVWLISVAFGAPQSASSPSTYSAYTGTDPKPMPAAPALGPANTTINDPTFGTPILRVTDANTKSGQSFISIDAGIFRAWNADSTAIRLTGPHGDGYWLEFNPSTFKVGDGSSTPVVHSLPFGARWEWSTIDPNIIYYLNGNQIAKYNKSTGVSTNLGGPSTGDSVGYMAVVVGWDYWVCAAAGPGSQDTQTKIFCLNPTSPSTTKLIDTVNKTVNGVAQGDPNWPTSASGKVLGIHDISGGTGSSWLEVTFHGQSWGANGGAIFNLSTNTWQLITNADYYWSGHVSMGNGKYVNSSGSINGSDSRGMVVRNPDNAMDSTQYRFIEQPSSPWNGWCDADHNSWLNSLTNANAPILVSRYGGSSSCYQYAWTGEIDAAAVDGSNTVWRFAHNHNSGSSCYYGSGFAQISNDGKWALFSSPWDGTLGSDTAFSCSNRIDTFILDLTGASSSSSSPSTPPPSATTLNASPTSASVGQTVTATWSIASPTAGDWVGLYSAGSTDTQYLTWKFVSCSTTPAAPSASGSCGFLLPTSLSPGTYQFRLFTNNTYTRIATSNNFTVTGSSVPTTLNASPTSASPGQVATATWAGIASPSASDWIGLYSAGSTDTQYLSWKFVSCSTAPGAPTASGSCGFLLPTSLSSGTYQFRLFANNTFTRIATSNTFTVSNNATGGPFSVSPNVTSPGGTVTVAWTGISSSSTDWIGLYVPGSSASAYLKWIFVSCSQTPDVVHQSGSCTFPISSSLPKGSYEMRFMSNNTFNQIAGSNTFTVQ